MEKESKMRSKKARKPKKSSIPVAKAESDPAVEKEGYEDVFRGLEGEPADVHLRRPQSGTQTPASTVYHDAELPKQDSSLGASSMSEWDAMTDRSKSPFELVEDEATRDLARTPSPDAYKHIPESMKCMGAGEECRTPAEELQRATTQGNEALDHQAAQKSSDKPQKKAQAGSGNRKHRQFLHNAKNGEKK